MIEESTSECLPFASLRSESRRSAAMARLTTNVILPAQAVLLGVSLTSCMTQKVSFAANQKATVSLVAPGDAGGTGQVLGDLPYVVDLPEVEGKVLKVSGDGLVPQYWVVRQFLGEETKFVLKLEDAPRKDEEKSGASKNVVMRLIMRSYAALARSDLVGAMELAKKVEAMDPSLAAPHILAGLVLERQGKVADAKASFEKALAVDPEDQDLKGKIDALR